MMVVNIDSLQWFIIFFDENSSGSTVTQENKSAIKSEIIPNQQLGEELYKPIIRNFQKRTVHSYFKDNVRGADLADMQILSKYNKRFCFLLYVFNIYSKYKWVVLLKDKERYCNY